MKKINANILNKDIVFYFSYILFLIVFMLEKSFYAIYVENIAEYIRFVCVFLIIIREMTINKVTKRGLATIAALLLMLIVGIRVRHLNISYIAIFVFAGRKINFSKLARTTIKVTMLMLIFIIVSAQTGVIENYSSVRQNGTIRNYLGFRYALFGPSFFMNIAMLTAYEKKERFKLRDALLLTGIAYWLYINTDSRLSFLLTCLTVLSALLYIHVINFQKKHKWVNWLLCTLFIICAVFSIYISINYSSGVPWQQNLNKLLGGRLQYGRTAFLQYGSSLLGRRISWIGNGLDVNGFKAAGSYLYVDCLYLQLVINYGIIILAIYLAMFTTASILAYKQHNYWLLIMFSILAVHNMIDDNGLNIGYCTFWFMLSHLLFSNNINIRRRGKRVLL